MKKVIGFVVLAICVVVAGRVLGHVGVSGHQDVSVGHRQTYSEWVVEKHMLQWRATDPRFDPQMHQSAADQLKQLLAAGPPRN